MSRKIKIRTKTEVKKIKGKKIKEEYVLPVDKNKVLALIFKSNKNTIWKWINYNVGTFTVDGHTYFIEPSGMYVSNNHVLCSIYLEGISTPMSHKNIVIQYEERNYIDPMTGEERTTKIPVIGDLKIDSELVNILLNRKLADEFTKTALDKKGIAMFVLLLGILVVGIIGIGVNYV